MKTKNLILRRFKASDINALYQILSDEKVEKYILPLYCSRIDVAEDILKGYIDNCDFERNFYIALCSKDNELLGIIDAEMFYSSELAIIYVIREDMRHKGLMYEAMSIFMKWLKQNTCIKKLCLNIERYNIPSRKLAEKLNGYIASSDGCELFYHIKI